MHQSKPLFSPPPNRARGGGVTALLLVMVIVVGAVVAYGLVVDVAEKGENPHVAPPRDRDEPTATSGYETMQDKPFPDVEPWEGEIAGRTGRLEVGMSRREVLDQFGPPDVEETDYVRTDAGVDVFSWYLGKGGGRIFRQRGGRRLIVKIDLASDRVAWFRPPSPPPSESEPDR